jgi:hypothetical protein
MKITGTCDQRSGHIAAVGVVKNIYQSLRTAWRVGLAIRYVISHSTRISDFWIMRTMWAQRTKPLLFPRPLDGSKLFRNLLFQVLLYYLAIT